MTRDKNNTRHTKTNTRYQTEASNEFNQNQNPRSEALKYDPVATKQGEPGAHKYILLDKMNALHRSEFGIEEDDH